MTIDRGRIHGEAKARSDVSRPGGPPKERGKVDYLRLSVTDRCNLRCFYCMPKEGVRLLEPEEIMSYEELLMFARAAARSGISKVRVTGGEPLVRKGIAGFVEMLASVEPDLDISMTTNGVLLADLAYPLKRAGLSRINVSLDSLDAVTYRGLTGMDALSRVIGGIERALDAELDPVKVNVVVLKGINDDPAPFLRFISSYPVHLRFIEYMPCFVPGTGGLYFSSEALKERIAKLVPLEEADPVNGWGPAGTHYTFDGALGTLSFITPVSAHFCSRCNRLRLSSTGFLKVCLFDDGGENVRDLIRGGASLGEIEDLIAAERARKKRELEHCKFAGIREKPSDGMFIIGG